MSIYKNQNQTFRVFGDGNIPVAMLFQKLHKLIYIFFANNWQSRNQLTLCRNHIFRNRIMKNIEKILKRHIDKGTQTKKSFRKIYKKKDTSFIKGMRQTHQKGSFGNSLCSHTRPALYLGVFNAKYLLKMRCCHEKKLSLTLGHVTELAMAITYC